MRLVFGEDTAAVWADCWDLPEIEGREMCYAYVSFEMSSGIQICCCGVATAIDKTNWTYH